MSFTQELKEDILTFKVNNKAEKKLELESMLRISSEISLIPRKLTFDAPTLGIIRRFLATLKEFYQFEYQLVERIINRFNKRKTYEIIITNGADIIIDDLSLMKSQTLNHNELSEEEKQSYLRGAFLMKGSCTDPNGKSIHLEISSEDSNEILFLQSLINSFELNARIAKRKAYYVVYLKKMSEVRDFLYLIGASTKLNYFENVLITREIRTTLKRSINLDVANQAKTNKSSKEQIKYLKYLEYNYPLQKLDQKLLMVMKVRLDYPEYSLEELLSVIHDEFDPKLSKSGLNHRLRKLKEIAEEYKKR